jgi:hypothetical protein
MNPYWLLHAFVKTPNISHATTTGLESAGEKQLNPTVPEFIENLPYFLCMTSFRFFCVYDIFVFMLIGPFFSGNLYQKLLSGSKATKKSGKDL